MYHLKLYGFLDILEESQLHGDIVQQDYHEHYYNNTYKMMMGIHWATAYCQQAEFVIHMDDDYYVNVRLLAEFLSSRSALIPERPNQVIGYVFSNLAPYRKPDWKSYITVEEYPWDAWPEFPTGGCFVVSMSLEIDMAYLAPLTDVIRFDDVWTGFLLVRLEIRPEHDARFDMWDKKCTEE